MNTAGRAELLESQTNKKSHLKGGHTKKETTIKRNRRFPSKKANEMEGNKLSDIQFKRVVIRMLKELTDNYKEMNGNYKSVKKEIKLKTTTRKK